jgi:hypothetical protein
MQCDLCYLPITPCDAGQVADTGIICADCLRRLGLWNSPHKVLGEEVPTDLPNPDVTVVS